MRSYLNSIGVATLMLATGAGFAQTTLYVGGPGGSIETTIKEKIIPTFEARTQTKELSVNNIDG